MVCKCNDPSLTYLNDLGYNVIRTPREGINPLTLVGKQRRSINELGTIKMLRKDRTVRLPSIRRGDKVAQIRGQKTSSINLKEGLTLMGGILTAMGAGGLGASIDVSWARNLSFEFDDVELDSVQPVHIGDFLSTPDVDADNALFYDYLRGRGKLFVITQVIRSSSIIVDFEAKDSGTMGLDIPAVQGVASADLKIEEVRGRSTAIRFEGPEKLAFGFKAMRIILAKERLRLVGSKEGATYLGGGEDEAVSDDDPGVLLGGESGGLLEFA